MTPKSVEEERSQNGEGRFEYQKASLVLEDGTTFEGTSFGSDNVCTSGEVVFQTGMVGYIESLTDPSYESQILVLTYPLIGNYGVPDEILDYTQNLEKNFESRKIYAAGLIVANYSEEASHWASVKTLSQWLKEKDIPAITGNSMIIKLSYLILSSFSQELTQEP